MIKNFSTRKADKHTSNKNVHKIEKFHKGEKVDRFEKIESTESNYTNSKYGDDDNFDGTTLSY